MIEGILDFLIRMVPGLLAGGTIFFLLRPVRMKALRNRELVSPRPREIVLFLFHLFCGGLALLTLTPRWFHWITLLNAGHTGTHTFFQPGSFNLIPLQTFHIDPWSIMILLGNVIMFLPIGFVPLLLIPHLSIRKVLMISVLTPLCIEFWQLLIGRAFDTDDLLLNAFGILLGAFLCRVLLCKFTRLSGIFRVQ